MNKVTKIILLSVVASLPLTATMANTAMAKSGDRQEAKKEDMVYATKRGKKYHRSDCPFIVNRDSVAMSLKDAQAKGLEPCGRCMADSQKQAKN